jgi:hypothetical protein
MSRSYKKHNILKDHPKGAKTMSKKKIRRKIKQILNQEDDDITLPIERELTNQYDVCDWIFINPDNKYKRK